MSRIKLLLIDDEKDFCMTLAERLSLRGFQVAYEESGRDGIGRLKCADAEDFPDVLILDMLMPDMDGMATLQAVHNDFPALPVLMLTGHAATEDGLLAMQNGAADYLIKPVDIETLTAKISSVLHDSE